MGTTWLGAELAWGRVGLGPSWFGTELVWGRVGLGPSWLGTSWFGDDLARKLVGTLFWFVEEAMYVTAFYCIDEAGSQVMVGNMLGVHQPKFL